MLTYLRPPLTAKLPLAYARSGRGSMCILTYDRLAMERRHEGKGERMLIGQSVPVAPVATIPHLTLSRTGYSHHTTYGKHPSHR